MLPTSGGGGDGKAKYKNRYAVLQQTYEERLQSLVDMFQKSLDEIHGDESLAILRQDNVSSDYVGVRVLELVGHALRDEKEHFIRTLTAKLAKKDASLKELVREKEGMTMQRKAMLDEMHQVASHVEALQARYTAMSTDTSAADAEVQRLRHENQSLIEELSARDSDRAKWDDERRGFLLMQQDLVRLQAIHAKDAAFYADERATSAASIDRLTAKVDDLEQSRAASTAECTTLRLTVQEKSIEFMHAQDAIAALQAQVEALSPLEAQLTELRATHQAKLHEVDMQLWEARRKYTAVGDQVQGLIHDHDLDRAQLVAAHESDRAVAADALRMCEERFQQLEASSAAQLASLHAKMEHQDGIIQETTRQLHAARAQVERSMAERAASDLEMQVATAKQALENEQNARSTLQDQFQSYKRIADGKMEALQAALQAKQDANEQAEKRMLQWQDSAMKKHDKLVQTIKTRYQAAAKSTEDCDAHKAEASRLELVRIQELAKVAECTAKHDVPGEFIRMSQHKAELDKMALQLQTAHVQDKIQWEDNQKRLLDDRLDSLRTEMDTWKAQLSEEKVQRDELQAALMHEHKLHMDTRERLDEQAMAKTILVQRYDQSVLVGFIENGRFFTENGRFFTEYGLVFELNNEGSLWLPQQKSSEITSFCNFSEILGQCFKAFACLATKSDIK
ncbi:hypothetical protein DYB26_003816 [Aphanomyces astaci]|uniref:Uncharacterized protein n=1 Tax=Aphanomyces astaci TaxID=112090 RepID=A0A3R6X052_APHAT|nr:hypothetical protein DYB26_003816 [Aphanomyces astaci]